MPSGAAGQCRVRRNRDGKPDLPFYGFVTSLAVDPIEKKPLYHFRPGSELLSAGFAGCNLHCPFCQNWQISQSTDVSGRKISPAGLIALALEAVKATAQQHGAAIAYTYSEPLIHAEYLLDCMKEGRKAGVANVLVSNGCINSEAADEILDLTDAANIDLKSFSRETYKNVLGGDLDTVTGFIQSACKKQTALELTTLIVPGLNDSRAELDLCRDFIAELHSGGNTVPWHLSAYHPDYKWNAPATDPSSLIAAASRARDKLPYVYTGNIGTREGDRKFSDTLCPDCGKTLVARNGYRIDTSGLVFNGTYLCASCGSKAPVRY